LPALGSSGSPAASWAGSGRQPEQATLYSYLRLAREPASPRYRRLAPTALALYLGMGLGWPSSLFVLALFLGLSAGAVKENRATDACPESRQSLCGQLHLIATRRARRSSKLLNLDEPPGHEAFHVSRLPSSMAVRISRSRSALPHAHDVRKMNIEAAGRRHFAFRLWPAAARGVWTEVPLTIDKDTRYGRAG
jgi:hypothetical protein